MSRYVHVAVLAIGMLAAGWSLAARRGAALDGPAPATRWEIGVYRVASGEHPFEWQDGGQRVFGATRRILLEKLGLSRVTWDLERVHTESSPPFPAAVIDTALLNELARRGWQLREIDPVGSGRTYWLQRQRP